MPNESENNSLRNAGSVETHKLIKSDINLHKWILLVQSNRFSRETKPLDDFTSKHTAFVIVRRQTTVTSDLSRYSKVKLVFRTIRTRSCAEVGTTATQLVVLARRNRSYNIIVHTESVIGRTSTRRRKLADRTDSLQSKQSIQSPHYYLVIRARDRLVSLCNAVAHCGCGSTRIDLEQCK